MVKTKDLRSKTIDELTKDLNESRKQLSEMRLNQNVSQAQATRISKIKNVRKDIARTLTVINQSKIADARKANKSQKHLDLNLRRKATRSIRRKLTKNQAGKITLKAQKKAENYPQRVFTVAE